MKTLLFCNLIPLKTGAYETLLAAVGEEFRQARPAGSAGSPQAGSGQAGDEYIIVFAGEPIPPVAASLRTAGVRWRVMREWVGGKTKSAKRKTDLSAGGGEAISSSRLRVKPSSSERVRQWAFVLPALRLIRRERPDVVAVHFGNELPTLVASLLCKLTMRKPPRWIWEQDQQIQDPGRISRWLSKIRLLGLGVDQYLAVYEGGRQSMLKRGIPAAKITVIHNSVAPYTPLRPKGWLRGELCERECEEQSISHEAAKGAKGGNCISAGGGEGKSSLRASRPSVQTPDSADQEPIAVPDDVLLVTNGSLIPRKRTDFILRACAGVGGIGSFENGSIGESLPALGASPSEPNATNATFPPSALSPPLPNATNATNETTNWHLLIIGEGPERERLVALASELGISDRVHFLGLRNDVREILPECDLYLHASKAETCTYAVTESMAAGIPAVMLNAGAAREQIEDRVTGYVFDEAEIVPFADCLRGLIGDPARRAGMGRLARARWEAKFVVARAAAKYHELYEKVIRQ